MAVQQVGSEEDEDHIYSVEVDEKTREVNSYKTPRGTSPDAREWIPSTELPSSLRNVFNHHYTRLHPDVMLGF